MQTRLHLNLAMLSLLLAIADVIALSATGLVIDKCFVSYLELPHHSKFPARYFATGVDLAVVEAL